FESLPVLPLRKTLLAALAALRPVFSLVAMRVTSSPPQWWHGETRPIILPAQVWLQRAIRQRLQYRRCVIWASYLAICAVLCA
ncbi:hypothetical protein NEH44_12185, partial [Xanthomonas hortorum pv. pelargonii]|uniref:hypothetical protein n=1 Tax=Xanthomonas hortorum TaxID=56454 RepID=UPI00204469EF